MIPWITITGLGGITVTLPAAVAVTAWLAGGRAWRLAIWWSFLFLAGMTVVVASKIAFVGWGIGIRSLDFTGFSGHAMRATALLPVMLYLILAGRPLAARVIGALAGLALGILIGISRLAVQVHSVSEVVSGCVLGALVSVAFIAVVRKLRVAAPNRWMVAVSLVGLLAFSAEEAAPTQQWIEQIALALSGHDRPFSKHSWALD